jgi:hypothetical protein
MGTSETYSPKYSWRSIAIGLITEQKLPVQTLHQRLRPESGRLTYASSFSSQSGLLSLCSAQLHTNMSAKLDLGCG